jgi:nicotinate-nucleotide adenylyltransferase
LFFGIKNLMATTIALFGTSADPPTAGHQAILTGLAQQFDEVAVWASDNPFKSHQTPLEHRERMLQLLIEELPQRNVHLYEELSHPRALITVDRARMHWVNAELTLVVGADLVAQLPRWYQVEDLLHQVKLLVVPRPGYDLSKTALLPLRQMGATVAIADLAAPAVSSTAYRECSDLEVVPPPVQAYIHQEQLYKCQPKNPVTPNTLTPNTLTPRS